MELPIERRLAIIDRQINEWKEVGYNAEIAAQVHARIGSLPADIKAYADRAIQAETAIQALAAMRADIQKEPERA